jgi:hypothetical protein
MQWVTLPSMGRAAENRTVAKRFDFPPGGVMSPEKVAHVI